MKRSSIKAWLRAHRLMAAFLLCLPLSAPEAAPAAEKQPPAPPPGNEVVISVWQFNFPGLPDKRSCRTRVVITNRSEAVVTWSGKLFLLDGKKEQLEGWHVGAAKIKPNEATERLFSCAPGARTLRIEGGQLSEDACPGGACSPRVKIESNLKWE